MAQKILFDTDIGSDIDDAVCLAYLLANPECELLGVTTVTAEAEKRAMLASVMCRIAGKDVPVYPGAENPLLIQQLQVKAKQAGALKRWSHRTKFPKGEAIEFLRSTIRKYPGEVILLTVAPLTNIGLLFSVDPEIPVLLKAVYSMCGNFLRKITKVKAEWNAKVDYHAAAIMYNSRVKLHRSFGLNVTTKVTMKPEEFKSRFSSHDLLKPVVDFSRAWFRDCPLVTFHDPLAAAAVFDKSICRYKRGNVRVELEDPEKRGVTTWKPDKKGNHEIAVEVNPHKFFQTYFSHFN